MSSLEVALGLFVVVLGLLYYYLTSTFSHWKDKGVRFAKPVPIFGSAMPVLTLRVHIGEFFQNIYEMAGKDPFFGYFRGRIPGLLIRDPEIIKNIFVKDFSHFNNRILQLGDNVNSLLTRNLFNLEGHRWKEMRMKISPTFTSGRMKGMFPLVNEIAENLEEHLDTLANTGKDVDARDLLARYTTDVIGSCAFGVKCDSINDPNCLFRKMGIELFSMSVLRAARRVAWLLFPKIANILNISFIPEVVTKFFRTMVRDVMAMRARTGETRKDFMQLLIELKEKGRLSPEEGEKEEKNSKYSPGVDSKLEEDDVTAQAVVFFIAGFDTSSLATMYPLIELARQPELQRRVRCQIKEVLQRHDGKMSYQALKEMTYLDWIMKEGLRLYPPASILFRLCNQKYQIPGHKVTIDEGTIVVMPVRAMQRDPAYFKDPEKFEPERFKDDNLHQYVYMPFGEGPRQCLGVRFAGMQVKMGLLAILRKFEVQPSPNTKYPLIWDPKQFVLLPKGNVYVKFVRAQD